MIGMDWVRTLSPSTSVGTTADGLRSKYSCFLRSSDPRPPTTLTGSYWIPLSASAIQAR